MVRTTFSGSLDSRKKDLVHSGRSRYKIQRGEADNNFQNWQIGHSRSGRFSIHKFALSELGAQTRNEQKY